jgi:hypothetical protein
MTCSTIGKIGQMLLARKSLMSEQPHPITFDKIILKLERLHPILKYLKQQFYSFADTSGRLQMKDLPQIMQSIHSSMVSLLPCVNLYRTVLHLH